MNNFTVISMIVGLFQLTIAWYALRLNRIFGSARVGWSLFSAFVLLALLHLFQSMEQIQNTGEVQLHGDVIYSLISLLLLIGMVHIENVSKERLRGEREEQRLRSELESQVKERTADLTKANEELRREIEERKQMQTQMEENQKNLLASAEQAGMAEVATNVLHNVGNVLNSINVSANLIFDHVKQSKSSNVARVATLMREHSADLGEFITRDPRGQQLPSFLGQLAEHLTQEQESVLKELGSLKSNIGHISDIIAIQQSYSKIAGLTETVNISDLVEDSLRMNSGALVRHDVKVVRECDSNIPEITVQKHKVLQILVNLIRNAKYACDESGREDKCLAMRVSNGGDRVRISVVDNGVGITAENLPKIFNRGFSTRNNGHGFGLHSSAQAAKEMGGGLLVHSDGLGKGTTFTLELPIPQKKNP